MNLLDIATRYVFFTGKGGVGKTSNACALAVGLAALNIDPESAAPAYRDRVVGPYRGVLPDEAVRGMEEQLSGACTVEVAAFDEFTELLTGAGASAAFDHVIFDTAPTGHTLRLLQLPAAWTGFLDSNQRGASCLGPASGLKTQHERYAQAVATLADPARTTMVVVARPERPALAEAARTVTELGALDLTNQVLLVNGVFHATMPDDPVAQALEAQGRRALDDLPVALSGLPTVETALRANNILGVEALRGLLHAAPRPGILEEPAQPAVALPGLDALVQEIAGAGHGLVMVMGKGGVGKTTIATAIAEDLASRGLPVHLTTTDPASHLAPSAGAQMPSLRVSRIDPAAETAAYRRKVMERAGRTLDAAGLALLEEDLRSPCTEEVAVFHAFSRLVFGARREIVIMDTAPTGHTLLLLDATGAYHREVLRTAADVPGGIHTPLMRLRDPAYTRVLIVTLPETTPVTEAAQLQDDLRRAEIEPFAWVINTSLAVAEPSDPMLRARARAEWSQIEQVRPALPRRSRSCPGAPMA